MGETDKKQFLLLQGRPIVFRTLECFIASHLFSAVSLVVPHEECDRITGECDALYGSGTVAVVAGGESRQASVANGLGALPDSCTVIMVHDAVRPFIKRSMLEESLEAVTTVSGAIYALPVVDSLVRIKDKAVEGYVDRDAICRVQTPQTFQSEALRRAFDQADKDHFIGTDEASLLRRAGYQVCVLSGYEDNIKITTPDDLKRAEYIASHWSYE